MEASFTVYTAAHFLQHQKKKKKFLQDLPNHNTMPETTKMVALPHTV